MNQDKSGGHATKQLLTAKKKSLTREQGTPDDSFLITLLLLSFTLMNSFILLFSGKKSFGHIFHFSHDYTDKHKYVAALNQIIHLGCLALINE